MTERPSAPGSWIEVARFPRRKECQERALVLHAMGIPSGIVQAQGFHLVIAPSEVAERARAEIERYERENVGWPPRERPLPPLAHGAQVALVYVATIALFHLLATRAAFGVEWTRIGAALADEIRGGALWRTVTALTLHRDLLHLIGNAVFGSVFLVILAQSVGFGRACLGAVLAGGLGNLINAWMQDPSHASVGASTAVFGVLGLQVAYEWMKRRELGYVGWRRFAPILGGLLLLGWLGTGGAISMEQFGTAEERARALDRAIAGVDVLAHVFGFVAGAALGAGLALRPGRVRTTPESERWIALGGAGLIAACWTLAVVAR